LRRNLNELVDTAGNFYVTICIITNILKHGKRQFSSTET
jgi:hypothetical protein